MVINSVAYSDTFGVILNNFIHLPKGLANSTDVVDKFCKFTLQAFSCNYEVIQEFKSTITVLTTFGFTATLAPMMTSNFWRGSFCKKANKVTLLAAQTLDLAKGLDTMQLISLGRISHSLGRFSVFSNVMRVSPPLAVTKDALIVLSTLFSIKVNYDESDRLAKRNLNDAVGERFIWLNENTPRIENESDKARKERLNNEATAYTINEVHTNRIALITDVAKIVIVGLMLAIALCGAGFTTVLVTTTYGAITVGTAVNVFGLISASTALIKAIHGYVNPK